MPPASSCVPLQGLASHIPIVLPQDKVFKPSLCLCPSGMDLSQHISKRGHRFRPVLALGPWVALPGVSPALCWGVEGQPHSQSCPSTPEPGRNHTSTGCL